ncbi:hypothetical protein P7K49_021221 [Saguinus oedipus]|uniref:Uncharacterized protein n=1 Tax=Saguinus oedipus TaxID=9490 RepID=A0ABQ9US25_SAGOE|nr:hypothetical protein P7K49_021221 [Saguinus oedipus]
MEEDCHQKIDELFSGKLYLIGIAAIVVAVIMRRRPPADLRDDPEHGAVLWHPEQLRVLRPRRSGRRDPCRGPNPTAPRTLRGGCHRLGTVPAGGQEGSDSQSALGDGLGAGAGWAAGLLFLLRDADARTAGPGKGVLSRACQTDQRSSRQGELRFLHVQRPPPCPGGRETGDLEGPGPGFPAAPSGAASGPPGARTNAPELRAQGCAGGPAASPRATPHKFAARAQPTPRGGKASARPADPAGPPPSPVAHRSRLRVLISGWDRLCVCPERDREGSWGVPPRCPKTPEELPLPLPVVTGSVRNGIRPPYEMTHFLPEAAAVLAASSRWRWDHGKPARLSVSPRAFWELQAWPLLFLFSLVSSGIVSPTNAAVPGLFPSRTTGPRCQGVEKLTHAHKTTRPDRRRERPPSALWEV